MTLADKIEELEQRIYELECVLKHYKKPFIIPGWMIPYEFTDTTANADSTIDVDWDWEL